MAADMNIKELLAIGDSDCELRKKFPKIEFKHVHKIQNEFTDALATLSSMIQYPNKNYIDRIEIEISNQHAYCFHVGEEPDGKPWYHDIKRFLEVREYQENVTNSQKRALRRLENHFFVNEEVLYRRILDMGLLRCVDVAKATKLLEEIHAGMCEPHMNGFTLARKILRAGYFWMIVEGIAFAMCRNVTSVKLTGISSGFSQIN
ncbi:PREDICTED: uncharacterized protein LOC109238609 [Nicotiana attenuata]|uniref:uncharacterized protein LOC109238609 n=1 Tax=Nicotiana attenuata TaxID=49451 RepID=UPI000904CA49|nr:PREDICTED: uncharacterized protein LOC109238609 [Nicotiana attenuata]